MTTSVDVTVEKVTVYPDRARVTCCGQCELSSGRQQIILPGLPLALDPSSVRATGTGTAEVRLLGVDVNRRFYAEAPAEKIQELQAQIDAVNEAMQVVVDAQAGQVAQLAHLDGLRAATDEYARGFARGRRSVEEHAVLMAYIAESDAQIRARLRELEAESRVLHKELKKLELEMSQLRSAQGTQRYEVSLEVDVSAPGSFTPEVSYVVGNAGWKPLYDIRFHLAAETHHKDHINITYLAEIVQSTGQDWNGVDLAVSTARPALNQRLPDMKPWYIDELRPRPPIQPRAKSLKMAAVAMDEAPLESLAVGAAPNRHKAEVAVAELQDSGAAVSYQISGNIDIPSDGSPHKAVLGQFEMDPRLDYFTAPRLTEVVYRRATVDNKSGGPLLAGQANLFVGDEYLGATTLEHTPVDGELELLLGVEERITAERELVEREVDKRLLRDIRQIQFGYEIKMVNLLVEAARITVQDQYPVSRHDQIQVKFESSDPAAKDNSDLHILDWDLLLEAGEEKIIRMDYSIAHPRSLEVAGLRD